MTVASIDQISEAIGGLRADVRNGLAKLDHIHECLHGEDGLSPRVSNLELMAAKGRGFVLGLGAAGGVIGTALGFGIKAVVIKMGW